MKKNNTNTTSMIYGTLLVMLVAFACLVGADVVSSQNVILIAAAVISVIGVVIFDMYKRTRACIAC